MSLTLAGTKVNDVNFTLQGMYLYVSGTLERDGNGNVKRVISAYIPVANIDTTVGTEGNEAAILCRRSAIALVYPMVSRVNPFGTALCTVGQNKAGDRADMTFSFASDDGQNDIEISGPCVGGIIKIG